MKAESAVLEFAFKASDKLAAKEAAEHLDGKKEPVTRSNPVRVIERQAAGGNHAMDMRVKVEFLTPGMQHAEEADFCAEMSRIACDFQKGFSTSAKQKDRRRPSCSAERVAPTHAVV